MSIEDFSRRTLDVITHIEEALDRKGIYLRRSYADGAVSALVRRSLRLARAIVLLADAGSGADAMALSRSLIDCWIVFRWITNRDSESRGELFWRFEAKQKERFGEIAKKYIPSWGPVNFTLSPEVQRIADDYPRWDSWGPGIKAMANEPEVLDPGASLKMRPEWTHESLFFFASCYLHPTATGLAHEVLRWGTVFSTSRTTDEESHAESALAGTTAMVVRMAYRVSLFWGLGLSDEITQTWQKYIGPLVDRKAKERGQTRP
jgi:Family of unknown function (DUF5677)